MWLPLQLALRPQDHDAQAELDAIVERVTRSRFVDGNRVWYVVNEQGQCDWVSTRAELAELLPGPSDWRLRLARWMRLLL